MNNNVAEIPKILHKRADANSKVRHNIYGGEEGNDMRLFTVNQVCSRLGVKRNTLYKLINNLELKSVKIGAHRLFRPSDVQSFVEGLPNWEGDTNGY